MHVGYELLDIIHVYSTSIDCVVIDVFLSSYAEAVGDNECEHDRYSYGNFR